MNKTTPQPTLEERFREKMRTEGEFITNSRLSEQKLIDFVLQIDQEAYERGLKEEVDLEQSGYLKVRLEQAKQEERNRILGLIEGQEVSEQDMEMAVDNLYHERKGYNQALDDLKNLIIKE